MASGSNEYSDEYVANLLKHDAQVTSIQHKAIGLQAFRPQRPAGSGPKPNLRFLRNLLKETDSHNSILLEQEQREAREKQRRLHRAGGERSTGDHRVLERFRDYEESQKKRKRDEDEVIAQDRQSGKKGRLRSRSRSPRRSESSSTRRAHRRQNAHGSGEDNSDCRAHRHRRHRERDRSTDRARTRRHADEDDERRRRRHHRSRSSTRSSERGSDSMTRRRRHDADGGRADSKHSRRSAARDREPKVTRTRQSRDRSEPLQVAKPDEDFGSGDRSRADDRSEHVSTNPSKSTIRPRSRSPAGSDSDPLADIIGPAPPPPAPEIRRRGRGAFASDTAMDTRFSSTYDPKIDVQPDPEEEDDWEQALEAMRDRQRWKQQGADRLLAAGFSAQEVAKWENGDAKDESDVKWAKHGEGREWDRGKVVGEDGMIELKAEWAD